MSKIYWLKTLSSFHPTIFLTIKANLKMFLDTKIVFNKDGTVSTFVSRKGIKFPISWISKLPKFYKQNTIIGDLYRSKRILSGFNTKVRAIKNEYNNAGYPLSFIRSIVNSVNMSSHDNLSVIISPNFLLTEVPYCKINEAA